MKRIRHIIITLLIVLVTFMLTLRIGGIKLYTIETTSMEPSFHVNDLVFVQPTEFFYIFKDDVITYVNDNNTIVTHRVISKDEKNQTVVTKGDSNEYPDIKPVYAENIIGTVKFHIPYIGYLNHIVHQKLDKQ